MFRSILYPCSQNSASGNSENVTARFSDSSLLFEVLENKQTEKEEATLTIDDQEYKVNDLGDDSKTHYVEVINLRNQVGQLHNQINAAQQQALNLQVALGFRENALRESIKVIEEDEIESEAS